MANYSLTNKEKNSVSWNSSNELVINGEVLAPSTGWTREDTWYVNRKKPNSKIFQYSKDHPDRKTWLGVDEISSLLADTYSQWGIRPSGWYRNGRPKERYDEKVKNFEEYGHPAGDLPKSRNWNDVDGNGNKHVQVNWNSYDNVRNPPIPKTSDPNWVQNFYSNNNIGGQGGDLSEDAKKYWTEQLRELGSQSEVERVIRDTSQNDGTWNMGHSNKVNIIKAGAEEGSTVYNSDNKKFDIRLYNISNKTDHKTDHDTNPDTVKKTETYRVKECGGTWPFDWCEWRTKTRQVTDWDKINQHELMNTENDKLNKENITINDINRKRNKQLGNLKNTVLPSTQGDDYVTQRDKLRNFDVDQATKSAVEEQFKNYYKEEKIVEWDSSLAADIPGLEGSAFDADYYGGVSNKGTKWEEAVALDDIDITARYGDEASYLLQDWSNTGRHAGLRAYAPETATQADKYEESITDADKQAVRDRQLGIDTTNSQTDRLLNIQYIADEYDKARGGDPYWKKLAKEKFLDPNDREQFVTLFRLSEREADKDIQFVNNINNPSFTGITQLEDAINQSVGEKATIDTEKFGALTQNVLKDTINEMKKAKAKEEFLSTVSGFSGFSEIMDVNKSLTNTILGDSGVGGYLSMISGGRAEESLEKALGNVTGIGNNVTYNWQKWFDEKLTEKYGIDYNRFLPLEEKQDIIKAFQNELITNKPYDETNETFSQEFLDLAGYKTSKDLTDFLENQGEDGTSILNVIKGELSNKSQLDAVLNTINAEIELIEDVTNRDLELDFTTGEEDDPNTPEDESKKSIRIEASFARNFIDDYLVERFDTSKSMDEFVEYLDIRQEEKNPFQTQDMVNAVQQVAGLHAQSYLDAIRTDAVQKFDADWYMDPTVVDNEARKTDYEAQRDRIAADWNNAKNNPDTLIDPNLPTLGTWKQQLYRFGIDPNNKEEFAKMHFEIVGQGQSYDPAEDILNPTKIKDHIYQNILPKLDDEVLKQGTIFGNFITPEEFADDMLKGLDPNDKNSWKEVLQRYGLESFEGTVEDLKEYIMETLRTGSAQQIREHIKYLNEKRQKPTQEKLGVSYIQREEDYETGMSTPDTQLYKTFQQAGFQGTEDEFYDDFFPDTNRSEQQLLTKAGKDDPLKTYGLDMSDPFASLGTISSFLDEDEDDTTQFDEDKDDDSGTSYFDLDLDDDEEWDYKPKKEKQVLDEFTTLFKGL